MSGDQLIRNEIPSQPQNSVAAALDHFKQTQKLSDAAETLPLMLRPQALFRLGITYPDLVWVGDRVIVNNPMFAIQIARQQTKDYREAKKIRADGLRDGKSEEEIEAEIADAMYWGLGDTVEGLGEVMQIGPINIDMAKLGKFMAIHESIIPFIGGGEERKIIMHNAAATSAVNLADTFVKKLDTGRRFNPAEDVSKMSLDAILRVTFGKNTEEIIDLINQKGGRVDIEQYLAAVTAALTSHMFPIQLGFNFVLPGGRRAVDKLNNFTDVLILIGDVLHELTGEDNLVSVSRQNQEKLQMDDEKLKYRILAGIIHQLIAAGHETTAGVIVNLFFHLFSTPGAIDAIYQEIQHLDLSNIEEVEKFLNSINYTNAMMEETYRQDPATPVLPFKALKDIVLEIEGTQECYVIPAGTNVYANIFACNSNEDVFGPNALEFKPERWIPNEESEQDVERVKTMHSLLLSFWHGVRGCPGETLARLEVFYSLAYTVIAIKQADIKAKVAKAGSISSMTGTTIRNGMELVRT